MEEEAGDDFGSGSIGGGVRSGVSGSDGPSGAGGGKVAKVMVDTFLPREEDVIR